MILDILGWIIFGLIAGLIAKAIMPGKDPGGAIVTIILGIVGAVIGGFIGRNLLGRPDVNESFSLTGLLLAVLGAIVVLVIYRLATGRSLRA